MKKIVYCGSLKYLFCKIRKSSKKIRKHLGYLVLILDSLKRSKIAFENKMHTGLQITIQNKTCEQSNTLFYISKQPWKVKSLCKFHGPTSLQYATT